MPSKPTPPTTHLPPSVSAEILPDIVFVGGVGVFLKSLDPSIKYATCIAMLKVVAQVRQGNVDDPDVLRALTRMEILIQENFTLNQMPRPGKVQYLTPDDDTTPPT